MSLIDTETFIELIQEYTPNLYRLALGILHNKEDAEDAVAEAVLKAYEKMHTLKDAGKFRPWIMRIAANEAKRIYAKRKKSTPVGNPEEYMPEFQDGRHELWELVSGLEGAYREVVILYFYEQFSVKEIGGILHIPEGTVKSRLHRAKQRLRELL